ncbi:MAG: FG-GAP repeat protein, partial [Ignavibacteria bacterium]|nr:FG-GAP repeat protein [Ignavibacteria bacterium]
TQHSNSDSLPSGVTKDWLNSLTDETGNRIIQEDEPETDALQQKTFDGVATGDEYGRSVSSAGDVNGDGFDDVIIGAPKNNAGGISSGRAYIFFGGTVINNSVDVILTGGAVNNYLGSSVSSAGDVNSDGYDDVIIGSPGYNTFTGRAYIYFGGASMNSTADVIMTGEFSGHNFGHSVSGAGDVNNDGFSDVIVGAYGSNTNTGKAYVYFGGVSMNNIADVTFTGETPQSDFGYSVSGAGDVNGDGYHDVIIGAYGYNADVGKAYIYFGGTSMDNIADVSMFGGAIVDFFGASVSNAGDVNDDGYSDVIVGSYGYNSTTGRAYIYYGGISMDAFADVTMTGETTNNQFGYSVSDAGDVNGDGFADVYVGAWAYSTSKGRAYLYYGGASMNNVVDIYMTGETSSNYFGYSVSGGGDVNGDGFTDMIAGAFGYNSSTGRVYIFVNYLRGLDIADLSMTGESNYNNFGISVSSAGDVNGDGYDDVIVGADRYNAVTGRAYIYFGGMFMNNTADVILTGDTGNVFYGRSVSGAGDVNNDGYDDVIVGSENFYSNRGRAYIYFGGSIMNNVADVTMTSISVNNYFGSSVSKAGDLNGDGFDDVIVSALADSTGKVFIFTLVEAING